MFFCDNLLDYNVEKEVKRKSSIFMKITYFMYMYVQYINARLDYGF